MGALARIMALFGLFALASLPSSGQVIEFEANGLHYQTLSKNGLTIMFAQLPNHVRDYTMIQVVISNGAPISYSVKPEDFVFHRQDGAELHPVPAVAVVSSFLAKASRSDVIRLVSTYESGLYGMPKYNPANGYEARKRSALAEMSSMRISAAAAASAIALIPTRLQAGDSTDGAIFYPTGGKPLGPGKLSVSTGGEVFEFDAYVHTPGTH